VEQAVAAGAVDGLTGRNEASVDGRQVSNSHDNIGDMEVLRQLGALMEEAGLRPRL